jgi:hypothetical protein
MGKHMTTEEMVSMDALARVYLKMRNKISALTQKYESDVEEIKQQQAKVSEAMKEQMKALGSKSVKTDSGTVMLQLKTRYMTHDWDSFKTFVLEQKAVELLERRIAQRNMAKFLEDNPGLVPPGLNSESEYEISVRKPT